MFHFLALVCMHAMGCELFTWKLLTGISLQIFTSLPDKKHFSPVLYIPNASTFRKLINIGLIQINLYWLEKEIKKGVERVEKDSSSCYSFNLFATFRFGTQQKTWLL